MKIQSEKDLIFKAIDSYDFYTNSQKKTLQVLLNLSEDYVARSTVNTLCELVKITKSMMYVNLSSLEKEGVLTKINTKKRGLEYKINQEELDKIKNLYTKKITMMGY